MSSFPYTLDDNQVATLGLVVLQVDETIERDFRRLVPAELAKLHVTRIASGDDLTPDTIAQMETDLAASTALLPPAAEFDVVGYACTSGTAQIGADRVAELVHSGATTRAVTNPLSAALAAFDALELKRIGIVSPYIPAVGQPIVDAIKAHGIEVAQMLSFGEQVEARVARISAQSIMDAAHRLAAESAPDGIFLSCTNLVTLDLIDPLERALGVPVLSSNQVLAWHMARLAKLSLPAPVGRLFDVTT